MGATCLGDNNSKHEQECLIYRHTGVCENSSSSKTAACEHSSSTLPTVTSISDGDKGDDDLDNHSSRSSSSSSFFCHEQGQKEMEQEETEEPTTLWIQSPNRGAKMHLELNVDALLEVAADMRRKTMKNSPQKEHHHHEEEEEQEELESEPKPVPVRPSMRVGLYRNVSVMNMCLKEEEEQTDGGEEEEQGFDGDDAVSWATLTPSVRQEEISYKATASASTRISKMIPEEAPKEQEDNSSQNEPLLFNVVVSNNYATVTTTKTVADATPEYFSFSSLAQSPLPHSRPGPPGRPRGTTSGNGVNFSRRSGERHTFSAAAVAAATTLRRASATVQQPQQKNNHSHGSICDKKHQSCCLPHN